MTLREAMNQMQMEMKFLGMNWGDLEHMLQEKPSIFPYKTVVAYQVYRDHHKQVSEAV